MSEQIYEPNILTKEDVFAHWKHVIPLRYCDVFHLVVGYPCVGYVYNDDGGRINVYDVGRCAVTVGDNPFGNLPPFPSTVDYYEDKAVEDWCETQKDNRRFLIGFTRAVVMESHRGKNLDLIKAVG